jgi:hypothetical protein
LGWSVLLARAPVAASTTAAIDASFHIHPFHSERRNPDTKVQTRRTMTSMQSVDVRGRWQTASGAVYEFSQAGACVSAKYLEPSQDQLAAGIKPDDVAYVGNLIGQIIVGQFHHRAHLGDQKRCPANYYFVTILYLTISPDGATMEGDLLVDHISEACQVDDRRLDHIIFTAVRRNL